MVRNRFIIQFRRILNGDISFRRIHNFKGSIGNRIGRVNKVFQVFETMLIQGIRIFANHFSHEFIVTQVFGNSKRRVVNSRRLVHVNHSNRNENRCILGVIGISCRMPVIGHLNLDIKQAVRRLIVKLGTFLDKDFSRSRFNIIQFSDMLIVFRSTSISSKVERIGQYIIFHIRCTDITLGIGSQHSGCHAFFFNREFYIIRNRGVVYRSDCNLGSIGIFGNIAQPINYPKIKIVSFKRIIGFLRQVVILFKPKDKLTNIRICINCC